MVWMPPVVFLKEKYQELPYFLLLNTVQQYIDLVDNFVVQHIYKWSGNIRIQEPSSTIKISSYFMLTLQ